MIHILKWILKLIILGFSTITVTLGLLILSILLWDYSYMDKAEEIQDKILDL